MFKYFKVVDVYLKTVYEPSLAYAKVRLMLEENKSFGQKNLDSVTDPYLLFNLINCFVNLVFNQYLICPSFCRKRVLKISKRQ
jgi:hypothetical protein